ncbi:hypothetical protein Q4553_00285 [Tenacibaculum soleae]|uniref:hypothetical protein n=1 Tax=Tenacibaculum soleae TaxID=447689 RepID=UPI0026E161B9|nr:hypothetical protein [Tenacibaculum soleae]MDO6742998.1 hypothetical protein [Tenacibaculum soleae]
MKKHIKNIAILFITIFAFSLNTNAQKRKNKKTKDTHEWRYELDCMGTGKQGTYLIKVWSYSKKPRLAIEKAKRNAVHGVIFKGFAAGKQGCKSQKPLARNSNLENEKKSFFTHFFKDGGKYMKFVTASNDGAVAAGDRLKVSKKMYKIGIVISVNKDELRKELENAGIIKSLDAGF